MSGEVPAGVTEGWKRNCKEVRMKTWFIKLNQTPKESDARQFIDSIFKHSRIWEKVSGQQSFLFQVHNEASGVTAWTP